MGTCTSKDGSSSRSYIQQPEGFEVAGREQEVCRLRKALYGLKQSPRMWYARIHGFLMGLGFSSNAADSNVYYKAHGAAYLILALYVDDCILLSNHSLFLQQCKQQLAGEFKMSDMGEISYCLGIQITRDRKLGLLQMHQGKYIGEVLDRFGMGECNPAPTPMEAGLRLSKDMAPQTEEEAQRMQGIPYRHAVGSMMYLAVCTRPDIAYAVGVVSQFLENPGEQHWTAVKRILRYLKGTKDLGLVYRGKGIELQGYSDADWAGDEDSRKSTSGYVFLLGQNLISWRSKKQPITALSSTEAEYIAASFAAQEAIWLRLLLNDIQLEQEGPTRMNCDNWSALTLATSSKHSLRTRHIQVHFHFIREQIDAGVLHVEYCSTQEMLADLLTKALPKEKLLRDRERLQICSITTSDNDPG